MLVDQRKREEEAQVKRMMMIKVLRGVGGVLLVIAVLYMLNEKRIEREERDRRERAEREERDRREKVEREERDRRERVELEEKDRRKGIEYGNKFMGFIKISGGSFRMGSEHGDNYERPVHSVSVRDFYMSKTEVTVGQYRKCVEAGVCSKADSCAWGDPNWNDSSKENHPINCVDWGQARAFAKWVGGDLPSEAQWEYASRSGGKDIKYPWGNSDPTCEIVNYSGCGNQTTPVCSKTGGNTVQGLCDMGGNVWEWVLDEWHDSYSGAPSDDIGWCSDRGCDSNTSAYRIDRGGSWDLNASYLRSANRSDHSPSRRYGNLGFRVSDIIP
jgi:formylglycine-generating enzyme required for sulfatase activity